MPRAVLCLPTYNERENLEAMIDALGGVLDTDRDRVLVIDDGSPDGTGEIADRLAAELPWVSVLHRETKEGIGPAYIAGFRRALADGAELVLEMDCDFSHDPADVPRLIAASDDCRPRARLALCARRRYGELGARCGGSSRAAAASTRRSSSGMRVRDLTGGFKCFRRATLEAIDLDALSAHGYAFQIETTYRVRKAGLRDRGGADHVRGAPCGRVEDDGLDRRRGDVEGSAAPAACAHRQAVGVETVGAATFEHDVLDSPDPRDRRLLGALVQAVRRDRAPPDGRSPRSGAGASGSSASNVDAEPGLSARYGVLSLPTVILFAGGEPKATVYGAQPRATFEREFGPYV